MSIKLYAPLGAARANTVLIVAEMARVQIETVHTDMKSLKDKEFKSRNPFCKVPVIETPQGHLFETNSILRYIARCNPESRLYGSTIYEQSLVDQWLDTVKTEYEPTGSKFLAPVFGWMAVPDEVQKEAKSQFIKITHVLNDHLKLNNFLVGNSITIADIAMASFFALVFRVALDEKFRKSIPNVIRWFEFIATSSSFRKYKGRPYYVKTEWSASNVAPQQEKKQDNKKPKEEKKKEQKKEEKPAKKQADFDEPPAKPKNPLDLLPETKFNLFDFKTLFVNEPDKKKACQFLFDNFDPAGFSVWKIEYIKAEGEGKVLFQTNNLKNGFIQRLEHFRKYALGVHGVYGEEPNLEIRGVWLWRGVGKPQEITELDSYEYHTFTQLDLSKESDRNILLQYWTGMEDDVSVVEGLRARDIKYFK